MKQSAKVFLSLDNNTKHEGGIKAKEMNQHHYLIVVLGLDTELHMNPHISGSVTHGPDPGVFLRRAVGQIHR